MSQKKKLTTTESSTDLTLTNLLEKMTHHKQNLLTKVLCAYNSDKVRQKKDQTPPILKEYLAQVYANDPSEQADVFNNFFTKNDFALFQEGNTILFKINYNNPSLATELLRIGVANSYQQEVEQASLLDDIPSCNAQKYALTTNIYYDPESHILDTITNIDEKLDQEDDDDEEVELETRTIEVVPLLRQSVIGFARDHQTRAEDLSLLPTTISPNEVVTIASQMGSILIALNERGVFFSDSSNKNWLLDEHNELFICDKKSFVHQVHLSDKELAFQYSDGFVPNEYKYENSDIEPIDADKAHAFILGKNIYQMICPFEPMYLREERSIKKTERNDGTTFDFSSPFFQTETGDILKTLITHTVTESKENRLSTKAASDILSIAQAKLTDEATLTTTINGLTEQYQDRKRVLEAYNRKRSFTAPPPSVMETSDKAQDLINLIIQTNDLENKFQRSANKPDASKRNRSPSLFFDYRLSPQRTQPRQRIYSPLTGIETDKEMDEQDNIMEFKEKDLPQKTLDYDDLDIVFEGENDFPTTYNSDSDEYDSSDEEDSDYDSSDEEDSDYESEADSDEETVADSDSDKEEDNKYAP